MSCLWFLTVALAVAVAASRWIVDSGTLFENGNLVRNTDSREFIPRTAMWNRGVGIGVVFWEISLHDWTAGMVGIVTKKSFHDGSKGVFFNGNITNGETIIKELGFPPLRNGDVVGMYLGNSAETMTVDFYVNDIKYGSMDDIPISEESVFFPAVKFYGLGAAAIMEFEDRNGYSITELPLLRPSREGYWVLVAPIQCYDKEVAIPILDRPVTLLMTLYSTTPTEFVYETDLFVVNTKRFFKVYDRSASKWTSTIKDRTEIPTSGDIEEFEEFMVHLISTSQISLVPDSIKEEYLVFDNGDCTARYVYKEGIRPVPFMMIQDKLL